ncbi:MAG: TauD/TfdA family dioxygenase [Pseudomonadales bacterium]|nr:TauD/TfdA family dioxygenase [Pseudomonadales bacterium]MCP5183731.1 TauD/TfdA family dioxygenase [Pseudomonadales bacterium]
MTLSIQRNGAVGALVSGVDLRALSQSDLHTLRDAFAEHGALFFHGQQLTPEQHIVLAESWGDINVNRFFRAVPEHPRIAEVRKEPDQTVNIGGGWHTDHSYDQIPALGSMLYAREVPAFGGDTLFASTCAAYDSLSDGLKRTLLGLRAVHSSRHVFGAQSAYVQSAGDRLGNADAASQDAVHPVVIRHPLSGRPSLYVNPAFTLQFEGWTPMESAPLLEMLYRHIARPEHTWRFHWQPGSLAFWDNRATWHLAVNDYHGERRLMHRITLEGGPLEAYSH